MAAFVDEFLREVLLPAVKDAKDKALLLATAEAFHSAETEGHFTPVTHQQFVAAASSRLGTIRSYVARSWFKLAAKQAIAAERFWEFYENAKGPSRLSIVQAIGFSHVTVEELERKILVAGLGDKSAKVRLFAVQRIRQKKYYDLLPEIMRALAVEKNLETAESLKNAIQMIETGCEHTTPTADKPFYDLWVDYDGGSIGVRVPDAIVKSLGLQEISRRVRIRQEWSGSYSSDLPGELWDPVPDLEHPKKKR